jgi:hypothetical protein
MKPISVHVDERMYERFKEIAEDEGKPVAAVIREAMARFSSERPPRNRRSILDLKPHDCGPMLQAWTREEIFDEMIGRGDDRDGD